MKNIYLDNAATTKVDAAVIKVMQPYFSLHFGNPSEYHRMGRIAKKAIEISRKKIANFLKAKENEVIFTSCATESINLAHKGLIEALWLDHSKGSKLHIITSKIEHKAVLETCRHLEALGCDISYLPVNTHGLIDLAACKKAIKTNTVLISIMYVNNEVGTIQPIREIGKYLRKINKQRKQKIYFHTDATQAICYLNCGVDYLGVDFLSFTGHKIYAPKGIGVLYKRNNTPFIRQQDGGGQEQGLRAGTENVPYIIGLGKAIDLAENLKLKAESVKVLRDRLIDGVLEIPGVNLTGHPKLRAPHIASFIINGVEGEALILKLSELGISASSGSACTSSDLAPSHVLTAMGYLPEEAHGSIRFSLGKDNKKEDINYLIKVFPNVISFLRKMAPEMETGSRNLESEI